MKTTRLPSASEGGTTGETRRAFFDKLGIGTLLGAIVGQSSLLLRALLPNVLYESPRRFKIGRPDQFPEGVTFLENQRLYIFRHQKTFHSISAECTHLGCTVKMIQLGAPRKVGIGGQVTEQRQEFRCPCHGSRYFGDGTNYAGPAPSPLAWYRLEVAPDDGQLIVNLAETVDQNFRLTV